ncbi:hypothetical protein ACLOJK_021710 [Asimina triloba]
MMSNGEQKRPANREPEQGRSLRSAPSTPLKAAEQQTPPRSESLNSLPKIPSGNSPYVKAKHVQLVDKDPNRAISLFWAAINSGDRVNSALKDMAIAMKQVGRADEAVEAIKSFRYLCSADAQESLDNVLLDLYKRCGRMDEQIELLEHKLKLIEEGLVFGGKRTKIARSQGKKFLLSIDQERSSILKSWTEDKSGLTVRIAKWTENTIRFVAGEFGLGSPPERKVPNCRSTLQPWNGRCAVVSFNQHVNTALLHQRGPCLQPYRGVHFVVFSVLAMNRPFSAILPPN